jgi:hypothetical protein
VVVVSVPAEEHNIHRHTSPLIPQVVPTAVILNFMPKPSTHRMHDPGSIVPHIQPKVFTDNQMSRIKYNYYISNVSKEYNDSQQIGAAEDSITAQEWQPGQHIT